MKRKKSAIEPRRRIAKNSVKDATPTRNVYSKSRRSDTTLEPRRKSPSAKPERKSLLAVFVAKGSTGLVLLGFVALGIFMLSLSTSPVVNTIGDDKATLQVHDKDTYAVEAQSILSSSIWNRNKITFDSKDVESKLQKKFPELESVKVVAPFLTNRPVVYIEPARPSVILAATNGTYLLNNSGKVMIMQANLPPDVKLDGIPVVTDQSNLKAELNKQALTTDEIMFIKTVLAQLSAKQIKYDTIVLPAGAHELDVHIASQTYHVKFNMQNHKTAREQAGTFLAAQQELNNQHIVPGEYIDVRLEGRAYYR